jgi:hypothetical protein
LLPQLPSSPLPHTHSLMGSQWPRSVRKEGIDGVSFHQKTPRHKPHPCQRPEHPEQVVKLEDGKRACLRQKEQQQKQVRPDMGPEEAEGGLGREEVGRAPQHQGAHGPFLTTCGHPAPRPSPTHWASPSSPSRHGLQPPEQGPEPVQGVHIPPPKFQGTLVWQNRSTESQRQTGSMHPSVSPLDPWRPLWAGSYTSGAEAFTGLGQEIEVTRRKPQSLPQGTPV